MLSQFGRLLWGLQNYYWYLLSGPANQGFSFKLTWLGFLHFLTQWFSYSVVFRFLCSSYIFFTHTVILIFSYFAHLFVLFTFSLILYSSLFFILFTLSLLWLQPGDGWLQQSSGDGLHPLSFCGIEMRNLGSNTLNQDRWLDVVGHRWSPPHPLNLYNSFLKL